MTARKPKSRGTGKAKPAAPEGSHKRRRIALIALLVLGIPALAFGLSERSQLPADYRNHKTVKAAYEWRDRTFNSVKETASAQKEAIGERLTHKKQPIETRKAPPKPELGYTKKDRDQLQDLISEERETP